jgi:DHA1 family multidrug resistance protein-like MFS transporter
MTDDADGRAGARATRRDDAGGTGEATASTAPAVDATWLRWMVLFFAAGVFESMGFGHLGAFTPLYLGDLHVPAAQIPLWTGLLGAVGWIVGIPMIPLWGVWAETISRKFVIVRSAYVEALLFGLAAIAPNVWVLMAARLLSGFVVGNTGVMFAMQSDVTPRQRLGVAVALISAASPVGMAVGPLLGAVVIGASSVRALLLLDSALSLLSGVALTLWLHDRRTQPAAHGPTWTLIRRALGTIASTPGVPPLFALSFAGTFGVTATASFLPILVARLYHGPSVATAIGVVLTASGVVLALATPVWGRVGDRLGYVAALRVATAAIAVTMAGQALAPSVFALGAFRVVQAAFQGGVGALTTTLLALRVPPERRASVLNFSLLPMQLSWFLGPLAGAAVASFDLRATWWMAFVPSVAAFFMAGMARATTRPGTSAEGASVAT